MIYDIVYDKGTRLRVRAGKDAFTEGESYGLTSVLLEYDFIDECLISHRNGSILIYYLIMLLLLKSCLTNSF